MIRVAPTASLIAEEIGARPGTVPWIAANAIIGLHQALVDHVRRELLAGERDPKRIARRLRAEANRATTLLEHGLGELGGALGDGRAHK